MDERDEVAVSPRLDREGSQPTWRSSRARRTGGKVTVALAGDVHGEPPIRAVLETGGNPLSAMARSLRRADLAVLNVETAVGSGGTAQDRSRARGCGQRHNVYSLGNFLFYAGDPATRASGVLTAELGPRGAGVRRFDPASIDAGGRPRPVYGVERRRRLAELDALTPGRGGC